MTIENRAKSLVDNIKTAIPFFQSGYFAVQEGNRITTLLNSKPFQLVNLADNKANYFYVRLLPENTIFEGAEIQVSSCHQSLILRIPLRFVAFTVAKGVNVFSLEMRLTNLFISVEDLEINAVNLNRYVNYTEETGLSAQNLGDINILAYDLEMLINRNFVGENCLPPICEC